MKLAVFAVGHRQPAWVQAGCEEYVKRLPREWSLAVHEVKPEPRGDGNKSRESLLAAEKMRLRQALQSYSGNPRLIALDERGRDLNTRQFSELLARWLADGRDVALLIGGADGLDIELKNAAETQLRLSSLTLPHGLARVLLCEQLYRAASLLQHHPYHRE